MSAAALPAVRGRTVLLAVVLVLVSAVSLVAATGLVDYRLTGSAGFGPMILAGTVGMLLPLLFIGRRLHWGWADWGLARPRRSLLHLVWQVPMAILSSLLVTAVVLGSLGVEPAEEQAAGTALLEGSTPTIFLVLVAAVVIAPIAEEMLFRRLLLDWLRRRLPVTVALLITSMVFAVVHIVPQAMLYVGLVGLWMAVLRVWSGALWHPIVLHASNNALASAVVLMSMA